MTFLVTGATGNVGAHVARALRDRGGTVRALVRDRDAAVRMLGEGVELCVGDFSDAGSLERALRGVDRLFLACGNFAEQVASECAAIAAAKAAGVERVVKLSGPDAAVASPLLFERWHGQIELVLRRSGLPWTMLRPAAFMTNVLAFADTIRQTDRVFAPAGEARIAYVDPRDVAAVAVEALTGDGHEGQTYAVTGPAAISYADIARDLSAACGRGIEYVDVPDDAARHALAEAGVPALIADAIVDNFAAQRAGSMAETTDVVRRLTGRDPGTFARFAREHAAAFGAPAASALAA